MNKKLQGWSLEDVLGILFGEYEAKLIVQSMRGGNSDDIPESILKNKDAKDKIVDGFIHLARNYYDETIAESYSIVGDFFQWAALELELNPLIVTRWLRDDDGIFAGLFFCESMPEGGEGKIASLKESVAKDFDSINLKEFSRADYWSKAEFYVLLFGEAYSDIYFPEGFQKFPPSLNHEINQIEKYLTGAIEKGQLQTHASAVTPMLGERYLFDDDGRRYEPVQILSVLKSKQYPVPDKLIEHLEEGKYDQAAEQLKELRSKMLLLLKKADASPDNKKNDLEKFIRELRVWCDNEIEINIQKPKQPAFVANTDILGFQNVETKEWNTFISVLKSNNPVLYYDKSMQDKKQIFLSIERKLLRGLEKIFKVAFPKNFKLIELTRGKPGERQFKFRITPRPEKVDEDYSDYDKDQILKLIEKLAYENAAAEDYTNAVKRATEIGISIKDIEEVIKSIY
jgi:hypothetical protein